MKKVGEIVWYHKIDFLTLILIILPLFLPFQPALNPSADIDLASGRLIILGLTVWGGWLVLVQNKKWFSPATPTFLLLFFLFWCFSSGFMADDLGRFLRKIMVFFSIFPLYFLLTTFLSKDFYWKKSFSIWSWTAFFVSLVGLSQFCFQFIFSREIFFRVWGKFVAPILFGSNAGEAIASNPSWLVATGSGDLLRAISVFPDPHMLAFYLEMSLPLQVVWALQKSQKFYWLLPASSLLTLLLTFSRGSYVGLFGMVAWLVYFLKQKGQLEFLFSKTSGNKTRPYRIFYLLIGIGLITWSIFSVTPVRDRFLSILDTGEGSNKGRLEIWQEAISVVAYNPLLGVGLGNYSNFVRPESKYREPIYAHNTYLDLASEIGLPGLLAWLGFLIWGFKPLFSHFHKKNNLILTDQEGKDSLLFNYNLASALGLWGFALHCLFETPIFSPQILPLFIYLLAFRSYFQKKRGSIR